MFETNATSSPLDMLKRLVLRIMTLAAVAGCTVLCYGVYMLVSGTGAGGANWQAYTQTMGVAGAVFGMDPIVASLVVPGLITSSLAMGVVLIMHRRS